MQISLGKGCLYVQHRSYVDGLKLVATTTAAINLVESTKKLCEKGGFHLYKFVSNSKKIIESIPTEKTAKGI